MKITPFKKRHRKKASKLHTVFTCVYLERGLQRLNSVFVLCVHHVQKRISHVFPPTIHLLHPRCVLPVFCRRRGERKGGVILFPECHTTTTIPMVVEYSSLLHKDVVAKSARQYARTADSAGWWLVVLREGSRVEPVERAQMYACAGWQIGRMADRHWASSRPRGLVVILNSRRIYSLRSY